MTFGFAVINCRDPSRGARQGVTNVDENIRHYIRRGGWGIICDLEDGNRGQTPGLVKSLLVPSAITVVRDDSSEESLTSRNE